ncbi:type VI secretion system protein TssA [Salinisphaera sp.]|uniref:type VI secretion system protein TssA n=1 Tax=Salinisphaera sp. TaxID=1914330 RepID=UPI000C6614A6|nr:type VI secretion system protein TssA [Salinisphaera sp.]MBS63974.1 type VI secretion system protein TssA [Salinisphaera sp.]
MPNLAALTAPITEDDPCGEDMSLSPEFDAIVEARRADDPSLEQGDWIKDLKAADWPRVDTLCTQLLSEKTKDIRVCVWLTEAWAHLNGFSGIASGYRVLSQLCATDWDSLHPLPDEEDGDEEARINNLARLLQLSVPLMKQQPVTSSDIGRFSLADLEAARRAVQQTRGSEDDAEENAEAANRLAQFESARRDTSGSFYADLVEDVDECRSAVRELESTLDEKLNGDAPGFARVHETLDEVYSLVEGFADAAGATRQPPKKSAPAASASEAAPAQASDAPQEPAAPARSAVPTQIQTRAQALSQLRLVADFFRRTEPHSPVAYLADTAANWGEMPLHSWLRNVIRDEGELAHMEELLGLSRMRRGEDNDSFE